MLTWYDGLSDVNLETLLAFQRSHRKLATVTTVRASARFGYFELDGEDVSRFREKPVDGGGWINGAFFVLEPGVFEYIEGDTTSWERDPWNGLRSQRFAKARSGDAWILSGKSGFSRNFGPRVTLPGKTWE